jgi:hypothetical protein
VLCTDALVWALSMEETQLEAAEGEGDGASTASSLPRAGMLGLMASIGFMADMDTLVDEPPKPPYPLTPAPLSALAPVVPVPSHSIPTIRASESFSGSASGSATAVPASSALRRMSRGRPKSSGPKLCHLCKSESNSQDPVQPGSSSDRSIICTLKWAYPPVDGIPQGNYCWYCSKTVECKYVGQGLTHVKKLVDENDTEKTTFFEYRNKVIMMAIEHGGHLTPSMVATDDVMHYETESMHHKRHGKCMSVRKFQKKFGKKVDQKDAIHYKRCHRNVVEQIIISWLAQPFVIIEP